eukprot:snap_masked-scaffold_2-processed-gene-18.35-mRNA-1 protein AED:1.00 eAED:1.00 QI:0/0/0/0/1/1/2/0/118
MSLLYFSLSNGLFFLLSMLFNDLVFNLVSDENIIQSYYCTLLGSFFSFPEVFRILGTYSFYGSVSSASKICDENLDAQQVKNSIEKMINYQKLISLVVVLSIFITHKLFLNSTKLKTT